MNWRTFKKTLREACEPSDTYWVGDARILVPHATVKMYDIIMKVGGYQNLGGSVAGLDPEDLADIPLEEADIDEILGHKWPLKTLLSFSWDSIGPCSSFVDLSLLETDAAQAYVCLFHLTDDFQERLQVIAAYRKSERDELLEGLLPALLNANGDYFRLGLFGSLPDRTEDWSEGLLPRNSIFKAYWTWLEWASATGDCAWVPLRDTVLDHWMEPNPMKLALNALQGSFAIPQSPEGYEAWEANRREEENELTDDDKVRILGGFLTGTYHVMR